MTQEPADPITGQVDIQLPDFQQPGAQVNNGDQVANSERVERWVKEYAVRLKAFLVGMLRDQHAAEEALQQTFLQALKAGSEVQAESVKSWLFQVAAREALQLKRIDKRHIRLVEVLRASQAERSAESQTDAVEQNSVRKEQVERIRVAVAELPEPQRKVVLLRLEQDWTFQQIANELHLPLGTVLTRMRGAMHKLSSLLAGLENIAD